MSARDPRIDAVRTGMDAEHVRKLLDRRLAERGLELRFTELRLLYSFYVPGRNFRAVYQGTVVNGTATAAQTLYGRILYDGDDALRYAKAERKLAKGRYASPELGLGAYHLPEIGMVLWTFPNDPRVKKLREIADPATLRARLARRRDREGWELGAVQSRLVRYIPTKRAVFQHDVQWRRPRLPDGSPSGTPADELETIFAKTYDTVDNGHRAYAVLKGLYEARLRDGDRATLCFPQPLGYDPEVHTVWAGRIPGRPMTEGLDTLEPATLERIAAGLAWLQQLPLPVQAVWTLEDEVEGVRENAAAMARLLPEFEDPLQRLVRQLEQQRPHLPRLPRVPNHGTFKLNHLMAAGGSIGLLDFDSAVRADPLFDVANFLADLHYLESLGEIPVGQAARWGRIFADAYAAHVPWGRRQKVLDWMVACLLIRKQAYKVVKHLHPDAPVKVGRILEMARRRTRRLST